LVSSIGAAFIATLYGVGFANLFYLPASNRLKSLLNREEIMHQMMVDGMCMIVKGESPRLIENKLSVYYQAFPKGFPKYKEGISK
jgi:chemotaxis protein MotA